MPCVHKLHVVANETGGGAFPTIDLETVVSGRSREGRSDTHIHVSTGAWHEGAKGEKEGALERGRTLKRDTADDGGKLSLGAIPQNGEESRKKDGPRGKGRHPAQKTGRMANHSVAAKEV